MTQSEPPPIAPPTIPGPLPSTIIHREGDLVYVPKGAPLPDRCIKCNAPAEGYRKRARLRWHNPAWYLLILVALLIYVVVALIVQKTTVTEVPFCSKHRAARKWKLLIGLMLLAGAAGLVAIAVVFNMDPPGIIAIFVFLASIIFFVMASVVVVPKRIDDHGNLWFKGAGREFLRSIP